MSQLESSELHSSQMLEYQVNDPLELTTGEQATEYFNTKLVAFIIFRFRRLE